MTVNFNEARVGLEPPWLRYEQNELGVELPFAEDVGDVYHARDGGAEQAEQVFLAGNCLPERWLEPVTPPALPFVIVETGFGFGVNFLATWRAWAATPARRPYRLHFVSFEARPPSRDDLRRLHRGYPDWRGMSERLIACWPPPVRGLHRLNFDDDRLSLTLVFGEAQNQLPKLQFAANAFYLDGFAPRLDPPLWSADFLRALLKKAAPRATLASWSTHPAVIEAIKAAGYAIELRPGFARKRHRLQGHILRPETSWRHAPRPDPGKDRIAVIGAGLAGASAADRFAARGFSVDVFEQDAEVPGHNAASANRAGLLHSSPSRDDNRLSRLLRAGLLATLRRVAELADVGDVVGECCGVLQLAANAEEEASWHQLVHDQAWPSECLRAVDASLASEIAALELTRGGWWFAHGGWLDPGRWCQSLLTASPTICLKKQHSVVQLGQSEDGNWWLSDQSRQTHQGYRAVVVAVGAVASQLGETWRANQLWRPARGQVTLLRSGAVKPAVPLLQKRYWIPAADLAGASFEMTAERSLRPTEHAETLACLNATQVSGHLQLADVCGGRVALRAVTRDRMPLVGESEFTGLWRLQGLGARGLTTALIAAELLVSHCCGEPLPLESDLVRALNPLRFGLGKHSRSR